MAQSEHEQQILDRIKEIEGSLADFYSAPMDEIDPGKELRIELTNLREELNNISRG